MNFVKRVFSRIKVPIVSDLIAAGWPDWREAFKELFIILLFSLMPVWLGLSLVAILTIADGPLTFLERFASSSDLGILAASLLGPVLYMMFRDEGRTSGRGLTPQFPGGLWFTVIIIVCCVFATVIYCFNYLSATRSFFNEHGTVITFVASRSISFLSWALFAASTLVVFTASTIRNSMYSRAPQLMSADTQNFVAEVRNAEGLGPVNATVVNRDTAELTDQLRATQEPGDNDESGS